MRSSALVSLCLLTWTLTTWDQIETSAIPVEPEPCSCLLDDISFTEGQTEHHIGPDDCNIYITCFQCQLLAIYGTCPPLPGTTEEIGEACPSDLAVGEWRQNGCEYCTCLEESGTVLCNVPLCSDPGPAVCGKGFIAEIVPNPQDPCCAVRKCSSMDVCVVDGAVYQPQEFILQEPGSCQSCYCTDEKDPETSLNLVSCMPSPICEPCPPGYIGKNVPGHCCNTCIQTACVIWKDDTITLLKPGDTHQSDDKCTSYTCTKDFQITEDHVMCLMVFCTHGTEETDGCCPVCKSADV